MEVTAPRIPCAVFATRMGEPDWVNRFADARRPGSTSGCSSRVRSPRETLSSGSAARTAIPRVVDLMDVWYDKEPDPMLLERLLASPLAVRARANVENKLARVAS